MPVESQARIGLDEATGELNVPNPIDAGQKVRSDVLLNSISDKFENNSALLSTTVGNEINRLVTFGSVVGILGTNGQFRLKMKLQNTETSLNNVTAFVQESEKNINELQQIIGQLVGGATIPALLTSKLNANQANLQWQSIKIQSEQAKIIGENLSQTIQVNQSLQYSNLNLANISQQMEENNRRQRVETSAEVARLLRTTSQMDLFGRKREN
jgi:murein L,D-transpeptidase YcbB/YkuD